MAKSFGDRQLAKTRSAAAHEVPEQLDNRLDVITPENISFQYRTAGPFRRLAAFLLDFVIVLIGYCAIWLILGIAWTPLSAWLLSQGMIGLVDVINGTLVALFFIGLFLVYWFYGVFCETRYNGRTLGKLIVMIRAQSENGRPISAMQSVVRNLLRGADTFPFVAPSVLFGDLWVGDLALLPTMLAGFVVMMMNSKFQRIGDIVAGTVVVFEEPHWSAGLVAHEDPRVALLAEYIPPSFVISKSMAKTLATYVDRRRFLAIGRVNEVASHLSKALIPLFGLPADTNGDLLLCALYHRAFVDNRESDTVPSIMSRPSPVAIPHPSAIPVIELANPNQASNQQ